VSPLSTLDRRKEEKNRQFAKVTGKLKSTRADMVFPELTHFRFRKIWISISDDFNFGAKNVSSKLLNQNIAEMS
jgi:hypothetical protein